MTNHTRMTEERLREIEALREKTTPGEWHIAGEDIPECLDVESDGEFVVSAEDRHGFVSLCSVSDVKSIAALHNAFPDLAAALREVWVERDQLLSAISDIRDTVGNIESERSWTEFVKPILDRYDEVERKGSIPLIYTSDGKIIMSKLIESMAKHLDAVCIKASIALNPKGDGE